MQPLLIKDFTSVSAIGVGRAATSASLRNAYGGLRPCRFETADIDTYVGEVAAVDAEVLPRPLAQFECRNNRLAQMGLRADDFEHSVAEAKRRWSARRIGLFLGTSTSGILQSEIAYRDRGAGGALPHWFHYAQTHNSYSVVDFVRRSLGLEGPACTVSAACASSAKVFATASRMLDTHQIDAAVVGGVDSLCLTTLYGFRSLQLTSSQPCRPYDAARDGISIGECAAFLLLERAPREPSTGELRFEGYGESSDAYHMSAPHPDGLGARLAMQAALQSAGLAPADIDYVNLHGTGTVGNDRAESKALQSVFESSMRCSSTKGATGHALGAAGALEAALSLLALQAGEAPGGLNVSRLDTELRVNYLRQNERVPLHHVMSNSFGFGGSNCSLVFGTAH